MTKAIDELRAKAFQAWRALEKQAADGRFFDQPIDAVPLADAERIITAQEQRLGKLERTEHYHNSYITQADSTLTLILGNRHDHDPAECGVICKINAIEGVIEQQKQRIAERDALMKSHMCWEHCRCTFCSAVRAFQQEESK